MNRETLLARLGDGKGLPALPEVLLRLDRELSDPEVDLRRIAELAGTDAVLAGQIIRMANSAYYSRGSTSLTSLGTALQRLGIRAVRGLVFALTLPRSFQAGSNFPTRALWRHSLAVAALASSLCDELSLGASRKEEAWMGGLIHDIGALALATLAPQDYQKLLDRLTENASEGSEAEIVEIEREVFGIDHAEFGAIFLRENWHLPEPMPSVAEHHHDLAGMDLPNVGLGSTIHVVHIANGICSGFGAGWNRGCPPGKAFRNSAWDSLGLSLERVEDLVGRAMSSLDLAETLLAGGQ
ncbi:MAG TPA: HDOD domain-containing protein [Fibrobacteria bacterium]|nr:HDOD domain-containing protein [Fibrobacteria bacterium]HOX51216.1 HDOD domain-containing protein [Fibrobacteria bacterium]